MNLSASLARRYISSRREHYDRITHLSGSPARRLRQLFWKSEAGASRGILRRGLGTAPPHLQPRFWYGLCVDGEAAITTSTQEIAACAREQGIDGQITR